MKVKKMKILLDTNIYIGEVRHNFNGIDYKNLLDYLNASGAELLVSETVEAEFTNHFKNNITSIFNLYDDAVKKMRGFNSFAETIFPDVKKMENVLYTNFKSKLLNSIDKSAPFSILKNLNIQTNDIVKFLLSNKTSNKKDDLRDYFIWVSLVDYCKINEDNKIIFISDDKIFSNHEHSSKLINTLPLPKNLRVVLSIADFLQEYGFNDPDLTKEILLDYFSESVVKNLLIEDHTYLCEEAKNNCNFGCKYVLQDCDVELVEFIVDSIILKNFYTYVAIDTNKLMFVAHLKVDFVAYFSCCAWGWGEGYASGPEEILSNYLLIIRGEFDKNRKKIIDYEVEAW